MDTPDDIPFPALPERTEVSSPAPNIVVPSPPLPRESTDDVLEREVFEFVTERLNSGIEENELVAEVREFGLRERAARDYVRQVSAHNLEENFEPDVLSLIADLVAAGKTPHEIVAALQEQDLTSEEAWRLLRDVEAMKLQIAEGRKEMTRAQGIYLLTILLSLVGCIVFGLYSALLVIVMFVWAARMYGRGKKRIRAAEILLYPPRSGPA